MANEYPLTPVELELMEILWSIEEGSVRDVMAHLREDRDLAYTSVSTILRILEQKRILKVKKIGRQHIYQPTLSKEHYAGYSVKKMVNEIFSGNALGLVTYLMNKEDLSTEELKSLQKLLDAKKKELKS